MEKELNNLNGFYNLIVNFIANYSIQVFGAILIFTLGILVSKQIHKLILKILNKHNLDETLSQFIANFIRFIIILMMGIVALGKLGISVAPFIAAIGALSLTAGLALQGSVSNFAAGVVLVATKPFKIGDTITVNSIYGEVEEIKLGYTALRNEDKEYITIPNKFMIGDVLVNSFEFRIVEGSIGVSYNSDIEKAILTIENVIGMQKDLSSKNKAIVGIEKFSGSSVDIGYRYWVPSKSFFKLQYKVNLEILKAFNSANITIPFPQQEIKILGEKSATK